MNRSSIPLTGERTTPAVAGVRPMWVLRLYRGLNTFFLLAVLLQTFLAGAMLFAGGEWRTAHIAVGHLLSSLPLIPLAILFLAFVGRLSAADKGLAGLLLLLTILQPVWLYLRGISILLAALHPVNALLLFVLPLAMLTRLRAPAAPSAERKEKYS